MSRGAARRIIGWPKGAQVFILVALFILTQIHSSEQQQNRRSQSSNQNSPPPQQQQPASSAALNNNQALRSSSQQRSTSSSQQVAQTVSQQAARTAKPATSQQQPKRQPIDPDVEDESAAEVKFECPRPDGLFADPASCKRFILCGSSHPWQQTCPPGLYFDSKLKFCTFKTATLTCGPVSDEEEVRQDEATQDAQDSLPTCDAKCQLPDCFCSPDGTLVPGQLQPNQVPQMILLSFSGAVNELVFDHYKKILGYATQGKNQLNTAQTRLNPNTCGIKATFFVSHEYTNYAQVHWLAAQGHEIGLHSISHKLPEIWWTDKANYSDWVEEMVGMREILLQLSNINGETPVLKREDVAGLRAPYIKPGGDNMYQMVSDFGLSYSSSIVAPKTDFPLWPFTLDSKVPFDCANVRNNKKSSFSAAAAAAYAPSEPRQRSRRHQATARAEAHQRFKRQSTFAGKSLKCPTKAYPGIWEVPLNPMTNEISTCHHLDQCIFPSQDDHSDSSDIVNFLIENFERHYNTTRAPYQINLHVQWVLNANRVRALTKFIDHVSKSYPNVWFVTFKQMLDWMRSPTAANNVAAQQMFKCDDATTNGKVKLTSCNRPQTCVVKLNTDAEGQATPQERSTRSDVRYLQICPGIQCPKAYPWFGNLLGSEHNMKTVLELVKESEPASTSAASDQRPAQNGAGQAPAGGPQPSGADNS